MTFTSFVLIERFLTDVVYYVPLITLAVFIIGFGIQVVYPRRITWVDHFPDVEPRKSVEQRFRDGGAL